MKIESDFSLKAFNTFGVDATAARYVRFDAADEIRPFLDREPPGPQHYFVLGGGSNLLFLDDIAEPVLHPLLKGIDFLEMDGRHCWLKAMAGETWDDLVAYAVGRGWGGIENLSFIPGSVGASAVQNIGAYGVEAREVIERVEAIDLGTGEDAVMTPAACGFDYRYSHFKGPWNGRFIITAVVFRLHRQPEFVLDYPGVRSSVESLGAVTLANVRRAVIAIRQAKLPDPAVVGNAGSFFKNPVVDGRVLDDLRRRHPDLPYFKAGDGRFKLAAGWLIERCGWKGRQAGRAAVHDRQALVLINRGGATGREILALSEQVRAAVQDAFGIDLEREVTLVGRQDPIK